MPIISAIQCIWAVSYTHLIDYWISFAKGYAQSVGLLLDSEAIYCWDNPIRAGAHCKYLERDIPVSYTHLLWHREK